MDNKLLLIEVFNRPTKQVSSLKFTEIYNNFVKHCEAIAQESMIYRPFMDIKEQLLQEYSATISLQGIRFKHECDYTRFLLTYG